ncbi:MAG: hypothetical protein H6818_03275 [Phycisphaerales bacterium]|nr:hypothetical protein [Phycisphaerales bacterium]MCB9864322.1 hypothetical protein [Phycisphaerales bacterium]
MTTMTATLGMPDSASVSRGTLRAALDRSIPMNVAGLLTAGAICSAAGFATALSMEAVVGCLILNMGTYVLARRLGLSTTFAVMASSLVLLHPASRTLIGAETLGGRWIWTPWCLVAGQVALTGGRLSSWIGAIVSGAAVGWATGAVWGAVVFAGVLLAVSMVTAGPHPGNGVLNSTKRIRIRIFVVWIVCVGTAGIVGLLCVTPLAMADVAITQPLAGLDRMGWLSKIDRLPEAIGVASRVPYLGWSILTLAAVAIASPTTSDSRHLRAVGSMVMLCGGLLWLTRSENIHHQLRRLLSAVLLHQQVSIESQNRVGFLVICLAGVLGIAFVASCRVLARRERWTAPTILGGAGIAMLWWRTSPVELLGDAALRVVTPAIPFFPVLGICAAIVAGAGLQRIGASRYHRATRIVLVAVALVATAVDLLPWASGG